MQDALGVLIDEVAGSSERRLSDLAAAMAIDTKLAWKLTRIVELHDPFSAGLYVPGASGMRILLDAARAKGVCESTLDRLGRAHQEFEALQAEHAGDRRTLDMLLSGLAEEEQDRRDVEQRKAAFFANASLWGVRAAMRMMTFIVAESSESASRIDVAYVAGLFGVTRTRPDVPWRIAQLNSRDDRDQPSSTRVSRPIDPETSPDGPPVLRAFCRGAVPELIAVPQENGPTEYRLGEGPIGRHSLFDLVLAEFLPDAGERYRTPDEPQLSAASRNRTPVERLVLDLVIQRDLYGEIDPLAEFVSELWGPRSPGLRDDPDSLPFAERVEKPGRGLAAFRHRHIPRHRELMATVFRSCHWDPVGFDTYRIEMAYPPAPTVLRLVQPLPAAPGDLG